MTRRERMGEWEISILFEDNHLLCVEKPANLPVQADASGDADLLSLLKAYVKRRYDKPGDVYLGLVHRLDRPVGGAMAFARTSKAAARLCAQFADHTVMKRYYAVLEGEMTGENRMEDELFWDERAGIVREAKPNEPGAKTARLTSRSVCARDGYTLAEVTLETGRKHQIRVQHALRGFPLWGDLKYGNGRPGMQIALWAHSLELTHPTLKTPVALSSSPPNAGAWRMFEDILFGGDS